MRVCVRVCVCFTLGVRHFIPSDWPNARKLEQALEHGRPLKKGDVVRLTLDLPRRRDGDRDKKASAPLFRGDKGKARLSTLTILASLVRASPLYMNELVCSVFRSGGQWCEARAACQRNSCGTSSR